MLQQVIRETLLSGEEVRYPSLLLGLAHSEERDPIMHAALTY